MTSHFDNVNASFKTNPLPFPDRGGCLVTILSSGFSSFNLDRISPVVSVDPSLTTITSKFDSPCLVYSELQTLLTVDSIVCSSLCAGIKMLIKAGHLLHIQ